MTWLNEHICKSVPNSERKEMLKNKYNDYHQTGVNHQVWMIENVKLSSKI
jgi:hypothetical protein